MLLTHKSIWCILLCRKYVQKIWVWHWLNNLSYTVVSLTWTCVSSTLTSIFLLVVHDDFTLEVSKVSTQMTDKLMYYYKYSLIIMYIILFVYSDIIWYSYNFSKVPYSFQPMTIQTLFNSWFGTSLVHFQTTYCNLVLCIIFSEYILRHVLTMSSFSSFSRFLVSSVSWQLVSIILFTNQLA